MLKIEDVKVDDKFERLTPVSKEELQSLENLIVEDDEMHTPFIIWKGHNVLVDGHSRREILKHHPTIPYTIKEIPFKDWREAMVWIVEHHIARTSFSLWQKLEMAMTCVEYWEEKEGAKINQGTRSDLLPPSDKKLEPIDMNQFIADKVGCSSTYVTMFKKVFGEASEGVKQRCKVGDMSIRRAHDNLNKPKNPPKKDEPEPTVEIDKIDILAECESNQAVSDKSNISLPDNAPIVEKMTQLKVPDETMWFAINPVDQTMQIFMKKHDTDKGINHIHVNSFCFKTVSQEGKTSILQVEQIAGSTEDIIQKDDCGFDSEEKSS